MEPELLQETGRLLDFLIERFGADKTLWLIIGTVVFLAVRRLYLDWRAERVLNRLLEEKERSIQRVANQERQWRIYFLMHMGMSREEAERLIVQNVFSTPEEARRALEQTPSTA